MLTEITINNFKCFNNSKTFKLTNLNLLTGYNGRGKSSMLQALLLLAQTVQKTSEIKSLIINGDYIKLDLYDDIVNTLEKPVSFHLKSDNENIMDFLIEYSQDKNNDRRAILSNLIIDGKNYFSNIVSIGVDIKKDDKSAVRADPYSMSIIRPLFDNYYYISADRLGPTKFEEKMELNNSNPVGANGQFRLNVINKNKDLKKKISDSINYIMDSTDNIIITGEDNDFPVLKLAFENEQRKVKAINTGFGYSYVLSILLLLFFVKSGEIIIENPEAHLHPLAQARLMELICKTVAENNNIQIFIETHSEHIINAVKLATVTDRLSKSSSTLYFFDKDFSIKPLQINERGQILDWPIGFFDQESIDLANIIKAGINK